MSDVEVGTIERAHYIMLVVAGILHGLSPLDDNLFFDAGQREKMLRISRALLWQATELAVMIGHSTIRWSDD